jgi:hypothetical protein
VESASPAFFVLSLWLVVLRWYQLPPIDNSGVKAVGETQLDPRGA